ncbi:hypothetical protein ACFE04_020478 [Oxalis oulophora]
MSIFAVTQIILKKTTNILLNVRQLAAPTAAMGAFCLLRIVCVEKEETQAVPQITQVAVPVTTSTSCQTIETIETTSKGKYYLVAGVAAFIATGLLWHFISRRKGKKEAEDGVVAGKKGAEDGEDGVVAGKKGGEDGAIKVVTVKVSLQRCVCKEFSEMKKSDDTFTKWISPELARRRKFNKVSICVDPAASQDKIIRRLLRNMFFTDLRKL